jgi:2'-5' RNA ligase
VSRPVTNLRLFVALYPPADLGHAMLRALDSLSLPRHRLTPPDHVHLTLQFIGDLPAAEMDDVRESVARAAAGLGSFSLTPRRLVSLPERAHPRLIAAETDAPGTLMELQRRLAHRLARNVRAKSGDRFRPHFTLCRFAPGPRPDPVDHPVALPAFTVEHIRLMRSTLRPDGATHHEVESIALAPG